LLSTWSSLSSQEFTLRTSTCCSFTSRCSLGKAAAPAPFSCAGADRAVLPSSVEGGRGGNEEEEEEGEEEEEEEEEEDPVCFGLFPPEASGPSPLRWTTPPAPVVKGRRLPLMLSPASPPVGSQSDPSTGTWLKRAAEAEGGSAEGGRACAGMRWAWERASSGSERPGTIGSSTGAGTSPCGCGNVTKATRPARWGVCRSRPQCVRVKGRWMRGTDHHQHGKKERQPARCSRARRLLRLLRRRRRRRRRCR
jgi:hypothetical protein